MPTSLYYIWCTGSFLIHQIGLFSFPAVLDHQSLRCQATARSDTCENMRGFGLGGLPQQVGDGELTGEQRS